MKKSCKIFFASSIAAAGTEHHKNNNKPMLKSIQPHEICFSTSITARISVVDVSYNKKTSCALHVITKNGTIFFTSYCLTNFTAPVKITISQCCGLVNH
jgi:hypothetical protein